MWETRPSRGPKAARWAALAVLLSLVFVGYVRLRLADVPLERDEGEYAYAGQLILQGIPPYALAYNMKFPGTYYAYALILAVFGHTAWGIHAGLLIVNAASIVLVFLIGRRLVGELGGAVAAVTFAVASVDRWIYGTSAHATHFVALSAMAGLLLLLRAIESRRLRSYFWSGVLFGLSVLMKQHAVVYLPFCAALVYWSAGQGEGRDARATLKRIGALALGSALPLALVVSVLAVQGAISRFWFWTFDYARAYASEMPLASALPRLVERFTAVASANYAFWILGGAGLVALWTRRFDSKVRVVLTGLLAASFLATCPGFFFREHYFILVLPAVALLCGVALTSLVETLERFASPRVAVSASVGVLAVACGLYVIGERSYLFSMRAPQVSRSVYGISPFVEAVEIGKYIKDRTAADDRIAVIGSEPEIYFYADRKAATGYIYTYALMEPQPYAATMQAEMIRELEAAHPRYVVFPWIESSWLARKESDQGIVTWARRYIRACYEPVGVADIVSEDETHMVWDEGVREYSARSPNLVYTFKRKSDEPCTAGP